MFDVDANLEADDAARLGSAPLSTVVIDQGFHLVRLDQRPILER